MSARPLRWAGLALVAVALAATFFVSQVREMRRSLARVEAPLVLGRLPEFELVNRDGSVVGRNSLAGRPWVADFVFTRCALSCPRLTSLMRRLGADAPGVTRVSFTVDPSHDTPEVLADYAEAYAVSDPGWLFLTGDERTIRSLVVDGFKLPIVEDPERAAVSPNEPILHSNRFVLVDGAGAIRGYYQVTEAGEYEKLLRDLMSLERDEPRAPAPAETTAIVPADCAREIEDLHGFFEAWFSGSLPDTDAAFARFEGVLADDFAIIGPSGLELDRAAILERVRAGHGSHPAGGFSIRIENARVRESTGARCLATYEEWQQSGDEVRGRISTVLFGPRSGAPNGIEWRHLQETWLPETSLSEGSPQGRAEGEG